MAPYTCYQMDFRTDWGKPRTYFGMTELRGSQGQEEACVVRLKYHLSHRLECTRTGQADTFSIQPMGGTLTEKNALAQEAINAAVALGKDKTARGACYSCWELNSFLRNNALMVRSTIRGLQGQAARDAVTKYASSLDEAHPLNRHLASSRYAKAMGKMKRLPPAVLARFKSRSGKPGCRTRADQLARGEYEEGGRKHRRLKRGQDPEATVSSENKRRPTTRASGLKKRPAAK